MPQKSAKISRDSVCPRSAVTTSPGRTDDTYCPELDEELQRRGGYEDTVEERVREEEDEELVVGETDAVVDPENMSNTPQKSATSLELPSYWLTANNCQ